MSKPGLFGLTLLCLTFVACGSAPGSAPFWGSRGAPPAVAISPPIAQDQAPAEAVEIVEMDTGDPGPVPVSPADPAWGNRNAPVTIVEFADFQCPFSRRVQATLAQLQQAYGPDRLRIVWKNNPLVFRAKEDQRVIFPHDSQPIRAVSLLELGQRRLDAQGKRALKVGELHDRHGRIAVAPRGIRRAHRDWTGIS